MIGFGTKTDTQIKIIQKAIDIGYTIIDTKDTNMSIDYYKSLKYDRNKILFCSKLMGEHCQTNHNPKNVKKECLKTLDRAGLSYWDIYLIHTTHSFDSISILDTYNELIKLKKDAYIKNIGFSNIVYEQLDTLLINNIKPDFIQIEIHPYLVEEKIVNLCKKNNIKIIAHSPFGSYKYNKQILNNKILLKLQEKYSKNVTNIILKWHIMRGIIPIPSSNNIEHLHNNLDLSFKLHQEDINLISSLNKNKRVYIKPNNYESIGRSYSITGKSFKSNITNSNNKIIDLLNLKGFHVTEINEYKNIFTNCQNINKIINNSKNIKQSKHFNRNYEVEYLDDKLDEYKLSILNDDFFTNIVKMYLNKNDFYSSIHIKQSVLTKNLCPQNSALYHRDRQKKSVKVIIYLNKVSKINGALKIVYPETNYSLNSYLDRTTKTITVPRYTYEEIENKFKDNVNVIEGSEYTCIIFDGSVLHCGGYIQKGYRNSIYIEFE